MSAPAETARLVFFSYCTNAPMRELEFLRKHYYSAMCENVRRGGERAAYDENRWRRQIADQAWTDRFGA